MRVRVRRVLPRPRNPALLPREQRPPGGREVPLRRHKLAMIALLGWAMLVTGRLWVLQVLDHQKYADLATQKQAVLQFRGPRGTIYDARGRELAVSAPAFSVYADPSEIADADGTVRLLHRFLDLRPRERDRLRRELARGDLHFAWVARQLEPEQVRPLERAALPGIYLREENKRYYPMGRLAAQVLGIVGVDHNGLEGLEFRYDDAIAGSVLERTVLKRGARGYVLDERTMEELEKTGAGANLFLTLDASLQHIAERELEKMVRRSRAQHGTVILLDPRDSAVLAMASYPTFDPNDFAGYPAENRRVRAIADTFEPGSTWKVVTAASALDHLVVHPDDRIDCGRGALRIGDVTIRDHKPFDVLTFREVIERSSNVGVMRTALRLGGEPLLETVAAFRFGQRTGVDLPGEQAGLMHARERWRANRTFIAYASFGQGIATTALQMANTFAAVANGGIVHRPYLVRAIERDGQRLPLPASEDGWAAGQEQSRALSPQTASTLLRLLEGVVERGSGKAAAVPGYRVGGKTGTAEKSSAQGMSEHGRIASFIGMVPARAPRMVALVLLDEPIGQRYGGEVAAPVFGAMMREAVTYLGLPPDREQGPQDDAQRVEVAWVEFAPVHVPEPAESPRPESAALASGGGP